MRFYAGSRGDNMRTAKVIVLPYDAAWKDAFEAIKKEIKIALGDLIIGIEHVGRTAVEGLCAKPCIDIDVVIRDRSDLDAVVMELAKIGYIHEGDLGIRGREAFRYEDKPHLMSHHLYVCAKDCAELHRHITFHEYLRAHPEAAEAYSRTKQEAAELFPNDIEQYIAYKSPCIAQIYAQCSLQEGVDSATETV